MLHVPFQDWQSFSPTKYMNHFYFSPTNYMNPFYINLKIRKVWKESTFKSEISFCLASKSSCKLKFFSECSFFLKNVLIFKWIQRNNSDSRDDLTFCNSPSWSFKLLSVSILYNHIYNEMITLIKISFPYFSERVILFPAPFSQLSSSFPPFPFHSSWFYQPTHSSPIATHFLFPIFNNNNNKNNNDNIDAYRHIPSLIFQLNFFMLIFLNYSYNLIFKLFYLFLLFEYLCKVIKWNNFELE